MKKGILLVIVILASAAVTTMAAEQEKELNVTLDVSYYSKYITKGTRKFGSQSGLAQTMTIDLYGSGFGLIAHNRRANSSGYENRERFKYGAYYGNSFFPDQSHETRYKVTWLYNHYPDEPRNKANFGELKLDFSLPKICSAGVVPQYTTWYIYPAGSGYDIRSKAGWIHRFGFSYDTIIPELGEQVFKFVAYAWYRDGVGGGTRDHDWSHATFGVLTKLNVAENLVFVPGLYYQSSWDDSVNKHDELYCILSMKYRF